MTACCRPATRRGEGTGIERRRKMFARTRRLTLRPGWPEDAPAVARAIGHEAVVRMLSKVPWPYRLRDAEDFLARERGADEAFFLILAHEGGCPRLAGAIGLAPDEG